jgi:phosphinothricin acetyltransferase
MSAAIRLAELRDAAALADIYRPSVVAAATSFELEPPGEAEMARRLAVILAYAPWIVVEHDAGVIGYAYASKHHERAAYQWSVDVTVYIHQDHHRRGVGRALYTSLLELLRLQGFYTACAGVTLPNPASVGLHESFGFRPVGVYHAVGHKLGAWHDVGWWELALRERAGVPSPPLSFDQVKASARFGMALAKGLGELRFQRAFT